MNIFYFLFFAIVSSSTLSSLVDNSIIPLMDYYHTSKHIDAKKYSKIQYQAIVDALQAKDNYFRLVSYNMLFDRYDHLLAKPYRWQARLPRLIEIIDDMHADIICFQELYPGQIKDLLEEIGDEYGIACKLPGADSEPSEVNGILYRKERFQCQALTVHYLSETPHTISSDPFSNEPRTLVEAHFIDLVTKKEFAAFCTQVAFGSADSREYAAQFIVKLLEPLSSRKAILLAGDFNSFSPHVDDPHVPFFDGTYMLKLITKTALKDARDSALVGTIGPISTYTNRPGAILPFQGTGTPGILLDHIFVGGPVDVVIAAVQPAQVDGMYASDHLPVIADCLISR